jgi:protein tyrosine/serine phosphatase
LARANFRTVVEGEAYRSGTMGSGRLERVITRHGIRSVVNLRGEHLDRAWYRGEAATVERLGVELHNRPISSRELLSMERMDELVTLLRGVPKPVLVHCDGGADRTSLVAALYRYGVAGETAGQAGEEFSVWYGHLPQLRPQVAAMRASFREYVFRRDTAQGVNVQSDQPAR